MGHTPDQLLDSGGKVVAAGELHLSMVGSVDIAYVVRDTAAGHRSLTAPARIIGMRSQGEAEFAIEQGETRYEGVTGTTPRQVAANQLIPLPEPARRGLINLADDFGVFGRAQNRRSATIPTVVLVTGSPRIGTWS